MGPHLKGAAPSHCYNEQHLLRDNLEVDLGGNLGVQTHERLVGTEGLDRRAELDATLVDLGAAGGLDRGSDVGRRDGTEETTGVAGADREADLTPSSWAFTWLACSMVWISWILRARRICSTSFSPPLVQRIASFRGTR